MSDDAGGKASERDVVLARLNKVERERKKQRLAVVRVFAAPPMIGLAMLILVMSGETAIVVRESAAVMVTALMVGGALIILPMALYVLKPDEYEELIGDMERRLIELSTAGRTQEVDAGRKTDELPPG